MKLGEIPTWRLREILAATERIASPESQSARVLRDELNRREAEHTLKCSSSQPKGGAR